MPSPTLKGIALKHAPPKASTDVLLTSHCRWSLPRHGQPDDDVTDCQPLFAAVRRTSVSSTVGSRFGVELLCCLRCAWFDPREVRKTREAFLSVSGRWLNGVYLSTGVLQIELCIRSVARPVACWMCYVLFARCPALTVAIGATALDQTLPLLSPPDGPCGRPTAFSPQLSLPSFASRARLASRPTHTVCTHVHKRAGTPCSPPFFSSCPSPPRLGAVIPNCKRKRDKEHGVK